MTAPLTPARLSEIRARKDLVARLRVVLDMRDARAAAELIESQADEVDRLTAALDVAEKAIAGAQGELRNGSVPLGQSVMRHWDAKILAARNVLAEYDAAKEASHE